jgi:hypothetical protein
MPGRRAFLQAGAAGALLLATARLVDRPAHAASRYRFLEDRHAAIIAALAPVILAGVFPPEPAARAQATQALVEAFDRAVSGLAVAVQEEIAQLLSLLAVTPARFAFAGIWTPIPEASGAELEAMLAWLRTSRFELRRAAYLALTQLVQASWYGQAPSWGAIGYPGPPSLGT